MNNKIPNSPPPLPKPSGIAYCVHKWVYKGIVYAVGNSIPGSGAKYRYYWDSYFCEKCLEFQEKSKKN